MSAESLALIELHSIARGYVVADGMLKKAPVDLLQCRTISPGKFLVLVEGDVASVDEAYRCGLQIAGDRLVDKLFLPNAHPELGPALEEKRLGPTDRESLAVIETVTVAVTVLAADAACKAAQVRITEMRLGSGIGGKGTFTLAGLLPEIEAAVEAVTAIVDSALLQATEIIPAPHEDLVDKLQGKRLSLQDRRGGKKG
jgi:microcompartment protein CcmL/EutN